MLTQMQEPLFQKHTLPVLGLQYNNIAYLIKIVKHVTFINDALFLRFWYFQKEHVQIVHVLSLSNKVRDTI